MTSTNHAILHEKYFSATYILHNITNFCPFRPTVSYSQDIHILGFPIDSHLKISKCHYIFYYFTIRQKV